MSAQPAPETVGPAPVATPISAAERIEVVDILRGFAIFGILAVNMFFFANPFWAEFAGQKPWTGLIDRSADWLITFFCAGKFYSLFSFLFGFGFAVQLARAEARGARGGRVYARRLLVLIGIGVCHIVLLWAGDILLMYALLGFVLLLFRRRRPATLLVWACIGLLLVVPITSGFIALGKWAEKMESQATSAPASAPTTATATTESVTPVSATTPSTSTAPTTTRATTSDEKMFAEWVAAAYEAYGRGTYGAALMQRLKDYGFGFVLMTLFVAPSILGMFLLGLYAGRRGILHRAAEHVGLLRGVARWGVVLGVAGNLVAVILGESIRPSDVSWSALLLVACSAVGAPALCLFYASTIVLLSQKDAWRTRLRALAPVGRMALTNYLMHSVICTLIYNAYGLGLYGKVGPALGLLMTIAIYGMQIPLSGWWLRRFQFGPAEWLWRSLTYGRLQPMRIVLTAP